MTIQVITEIVTLQHFSPNDQWTIKDEGESSLRLRKKTYDDDSEDDYTATNTSISKDSDDDSVLSTSSSTIASTNRVSFADELVTMEWTRPYTKLEDIPLLYYSTEETNRFRHQYRLERKFLSNPDDDDDALLTLDDETTDCGNSLLLCQMDSSCDVQQPKTDASCRLSTTDSASTSTRRSISRVVVLHNDKIASFTDSSSADNVPADFFDTPEFWSGSITWW